MALRGPQSKDQLEWYLAGSLCLIETGHHLRPPVDEKNVHRRIAAAIIECLNQVDALRPMFKKEWKVNIWDVVNEGEVPSASLDLREMQKTVERMRARA